MILYKSYTFVTSPRRFFRNTSSEGKRCKRKHQYGYFPTIALHLEISKKSWKSGSVCIKLSNSFDCLRKIAFNDNVGEKVYFLSELIFIKINQPFSMKLRCYWDVATGRAERCYFRSSCPSSMFPFLPAVYVTYAYVSRRFWLHVIIYTWG